MPDLRLRTVLSASALAALLLAASAAFAGVCGAEGQNACTVFQRVPSCDKNLVEKAGKCVHPPCGRQGDRPCVVTERIPSCDDSLVEIAGKCLTRGACGSEGGRPCTVGERVPSCNPNLVEKAGKCIHPDCGRAFERACPATERPGFGVSCDTGLVETPGCHLADCRGSSGVCYPATLPAIAEPSTNMRQALPATDPMRGFADLHVHMFANLGFGGGVMVGAAYDPVGGIAKALAPDFGTDLDLVSIANTPIPVSKCPPLVPSCGRNVLHGNHVVPVDDTMGLGTGDDTKSYWGAPYFTGWPKWHSTTHQQVYYKWLERAWAGGMRVMVMLAVNNEFACATSKHLRGTNCSWSMPGIDRQLDAAIEFQAWHERQPGGGWFKIVKSAAEAEQVVRAGKLAVILGIESDTLFGCKQKPFVAGSTNQQNSRQACTPEFVNGEVDKYYAKGVRYIFPVHDFDGGFAGSALFIDVLDTANGTIMGSGFKSAACPGISDTLGCNTRGLTPGAGPALLGKLMDQGWLIDLDHMSAKGIDETFALANARGGYPFFIGHGLFNEVYAAGRNRHERMRTAAQLAQLRLSGSVVSVMTQDELKPGQTTCAHSSVSFAQNLNYAAGKMGAVAFGSDFNGFAPHVGPRFGPEACGKNAAQGSAQGTIASSGLAYPITVPGFGVFDRQVTGQRTFDFNTDGLAHIGLYPDLLADLARQGHSIEPLMGSAALVVNAWKKATAPKAPAPSKTLVVPPSRLQPVTPLPTIKKR